MSFTKPPQGFSQSPSGERIEMLWGLEMRVLGSFPHSFVLLFFFVLGIQIGALHISIIVEKKYSLKGKLQFLFL